MARKQVINISVIMILVMAFLHKSKLQKIHRMSCRNEATFKANGRDFVVKESSSKLISTIKALLLANCARSCIKTSECKSFLFKKNATLSTEKNCQLLNVEKNNLTSYDMQNMTGWVYYEPLQQVQFGCFNIVVAVNVIILINIITFIVLLTLIFIYLARHAITTW